MPTIFFFLLPFRVLHIHFISTGAHRLSFHSSFFFFHCKLIRRRHIHTTRRYGWQEARTHGVWNFNLNIQLNPASKWEKILVLLLLKPPTRYDFFFSFFSVSLKANKKLKEIGFVIKSKCFNNNKDTLVSLTVVWRHSKSHKNSFVNCKLSFFSDINSFNFLWFLHCHLGTKKKSQSDEDNNGTLLQLPLAEKRKERSLGKWRLKNDVQRLWYLKNVNGSLAAVNGRERLMMRSDTYDESCQTKRNKRKDWHIVSTKTRIVACWCFARSLFFRLWIVARKSGEIIGPKWRGKNKIKTAHPSFFFLFPCIFENTANLALCRRKDFMSFGSRLLIRNFGMAMKKTGKRREDSIDAQFVSNVYKLPVGHNDR